jgi:hypothetical protein
MLLSAHIVSAMRTQARDRLVVTYAPTLARRLQSTNGDSAGVEVQGVLYA